MVNQRNKVSTQHIRLVEEEIRYQKKISLLKLRLM
jgi:hypothetical protein